MEILSVKGLTFKYPGNSRPVIDNVDLSIREGEFIVICGKTGSGKTSLLRLLKEELRPNGELSGEIVYHKCSENADKDYRIGFVMQNPKEQAVTDKVWHELAFGMENQGMPQEKMALRAAELSAYFGIESWYDANVNDLSGGQLQLLNLASVMATDPDILILDEPTAQLDPIAASELISTIVRLHSDLALTVVIAEHRLEELLPVCDRMVMIDNGRIAADGVPADVIRKVNASDELFKALPAPYRLYRMLCDEDGRTGNEVFHGTGERKGNKEYTCGAEYPITISDGRKFLRNYLEKLSWEEHQDHDGQQNYAGMQDKAVLRAFSKRHDFYGTKVPALEMKQVRFRYGRDTRDVLEGFDLTVFSGEIFCLMGGNASGKTTALNIAAGLEKPYSGKVRVFSKNIKEYKNQSLYNRCLAMLPQDVMTLFMYNTVREELLSMLGFDAFEENGAEKIKSNNISLSKILSYLSDSADRHPYDLSGGEQQLLGMAKVLAAEPRFLLLDEPTKGMDAGKKAEFADIIKQLKGSGLTCIIVTHDVEFAASCADRCGMCFKGRMVSEGEPDRFFADNRFYTTAAYRMSRGICEGAASLDDLADRIRNTGKI